MTKKIALFASGSGSNAENIIHYFSSKSSFEFPLILTNKKDAFIHERAKKLNVPCEYFSLSDFNEGTSIVEILSKNNIDYIVLAGFLLKISDKILQKYPNKIINIHPALLPKYGGKGMYGHFVHEAVVANGEKESGITIHYINENYDEGDIIFQAKCLVNPTDSPEQVAEKVHALEYKHFPAQIEKIWG